MYNYQLSGKHIFLSTCFQQQFENNDNQISLVGWVEARNPTQKEGVRLILCLKFGKMLFYEVRPEISPTIAQYNGTKGQYSLASINGPAHSRLLHSSTDQILAGSLHYATSSAIIHSKWFILVLLCRRYLIAVCFRIFLYKASPVTGNSQSQSDGFLIILN